MSDSLEDKLEQFKQEMLAKFYARKQKHINEQSVTHPDFPWNKYSLELIEGHYQNEITERFTDGLSEQEKTKEDVDVANMAFLDWALRRARQ